MRPLVSQLIVCGLLSVLIMAFTPALAYVEPGTGNLLLQLLFGGLAGISLVLKLYWKNLWQGFQNLKLISGKSMPESVLPPTQDEPEIES